MLVLIAGLTGTLGQRLANVAISNGLSVRGLGRNPDSLSHELAGRLESFVQSTSYYDVPALETAVAGVDAVICAYAPHPLLDLDGQLLLLRAAERAGIKIFIASSWSRDWTNIKYGDFEHYNNHIAFEHQIATTSTIRPVYLISGLFSDLLFTKYGPGGFDTSGERPQMQYWGDGGAERKWPWSTQEDAAAWTIDILLHGKGVQAGKGGFFKFCSGVTSVAELAAVHEKVFGVQVDIVRKGSQEDLEAELARLRKEKGRAGYFEYMWEAAAVIAGKGLWETEVFNVLKQFKAQTTLEEYFAKEKGRGLNLQ